MKKVDVALNTQDFKSRSQSEKSIEKIEIHRKIIESEQKAVSNFADKIDAAFNEFRKRGYDDEASITLAIAFYKDIDIAKRRAKREEKLKENQDV